MKPENCFVSSTLLRIDVAKSNMGLANSTFPVDAESRDSVRLITEMLINHFELIIWSRYQSIGNITGWIIAH
jgi:hypothetical protein